MTTGKRELIDTGTDKRYVRRDEKGRFDEVVDVGRSLSQDRKRHADNARARPGTAIGAIVKPEHLYVEAVRCRYEPMHQWARRAAFASTPDR